MHTREDKPRHSLPVSKPPASRYGNNRWIFYSPSLERRMILGSDLEYDECVRIEASLKKYFCEQPCRIQVHLPQGLVKTVFDFWVHWPDGTEEYREVKYKRDLDDSRVSRQIGAQQVFCNLHGFKHSVSTEEIVRANPLYLDNWKRILNHLGMTSRINLRPVIDRLMRLLRTAGRCRISQLESAFQSLDPVLVQAATYTLIHRGDLSAALDTQRLDPSLFVEVVR
jgi:hypothetical protein